jgi:hypothetical protein
MDFRDIFTDFTDARRLMGDTLPKDDLRSMSFQSPAIQHFDQEWLDRVMPTYEQIMATKRAKGGSVTLEEQFKEANAINMAEGGSSSLEDSFKKAKLMGKSLAGQAKQSIGKEIESYKKPRALTDVGNDWVANMVGAPVDLVNMALTPVGLGSDKPVLGSEYLKGKMVEHGMHTGTERPWTELGSSFINPQQAVKGAVKGVQAAAKATKDIPVGLSIKDVSEAPRAVNFVSSVEKTIKGHKMEAMPGNQWSAWMNANASKAAKKEAEATGLHDWLKTQSAKVSKVDIENYVESQLPKLKVVEKGAPLKLTSDERKELEDLTKRHSRVMHGADDEPLSDDDYAKLIKLANIDEKATVQNLRHQAKQTEIGAQQAQQRGDKYTALVNFSRAEHLNQRADQLELEPLQYGGSKFEKYTLPGGKNYRETMLSMTINPMSFDEYMEYNFPGARDKERVKKYYQDYLDEGKRTGTYEDAYAATQSNFKSPAAHRYDDPEADYNRVAHLRSNERQTPEGKRALFLEEIQSDWGQKAREGYSDTPQGPYVSDTKDWTALGLKHALKQAAEEGHDYMAWTTGQQQADRYSLAQYLDNVRASKNPDGTYSFLAYEKDASRDNLPTIRQEGLTEDELSQHLGKDMAKKIVGDLAEARPTQVANYNNLDLQIGGEGMKGYYDQIVPSTMNDVLKQIGAKERVKPIDVHMEKGVVGEDHPDFGIPTTSQHLGIEITPELRELILNEGLPHFHEGGKVEYNKQDLLDEFKISRYGA